MAAVACTAAARMADMAAITDRPRVYKGNWMVGREGIEPTTIRLRVERSTN